VTFFRSRRSRWLSAVGAVAVVALVIGQCQRGETEEEAPPRAAATRFGMTAAKPKQVIPEDIAAWSKRFEVQLPPPEELRADPAQQAGTLGNGIRYVVVEHPASAGEISLRLMVLTGSMHEEPGEEGFAHFIEHLAFQETGEGHAFEVFERLGLASGADTNAHTSLDHTLYKLDLPSADETTLETACAFLSRTAGSMTFSEATVAAERRVILREIDERPQSTRWCQKAAAILPGVPAFDHPPAGTSESVGSASRAGLWNFWHRHYVPSRMVVVAVGDLKEGPMIERLRRHFGNIPPRSAPAVPSPGDPMAEASEAVVTAAETKGSQVKLTIAAPLPIDREPDSLAKRRLELVRGVALEMLESRLSREFDRQKIVGTPPEASAVEVIPGIGWLEVSADASRERMPEVLRALVRGWRAALGSEFHPTEFAEARGEVRSDLRGEFVSRLLRDTSDRATRLVDAERTGRLVESPEDELNRYQGMLGTITREECEELLKTEWAAPPRIMLSGAVDSSLESAAADIVANGMTGTVPAFMHGPRDAAWIAQPPGSPGRVIRRQLDASRGYLEAELANHVLVRLVPIRSLGGYVRVRVDLGHGRQSAPPDRAALATAAEVLCQGYPMEHWPHLALNAALANDDVSRRFDVDWNSFRWTGETDRKQLRRQLDLLATLVHRPGLAAMPRVWRPDGQAQAWDERVRDTYPTDMRESSRLQNGFDPRFEVFPEGLMQTDSLQVADWLLPLLAGERLCVSIAGDFEPEVVLAEVAASFGALPARPVWEEASRYPPPPLPEPGVTRMPLEGRVASVVLMFPLGPAGDAAEMLRRQLLEGALQLRVREVMRERRGDSYAPGVERDMRADNGMEWLTIDVPCAKGRAAETSEVLRELVREFRDKGWTRDEFQRALRPMPHVIARRARHPAAVLMDLRNPVRMPAPGQLDPAALAGMEGAVRELARRVLDLDAAVELQVDR
jgi:zinc protease